MVTNFFFQEWALFIVRIILGMTMMYYGWPKIKDLKSNAKDFVKMGFKPGWLFGTIVAFTEFFGGLVVLLGFFAEIAAFFIAIEMMSGTIWKLKRKKSFKDYSYDMQLMSMALIIVTFGAGLYALTDALL